MWCEAASVLRIDLKEGNHACQGWFLLRSALRDEDFDNGGADESKSDLLMTPIESDAALRSLKDQLTKRIEDFRKCGLVSERATVVDCLSGCSLEENFLSRWL